MVRTTPVPEQTVAPPLKVAPPGTQASPSAYPSNAPPEYFALFTIGKAIMAKSVSLISLIPEDNASLTLILQVLDKFPGTIQL